MPAGIRVYNDNGVIQTDAVFKNFSMIKKKTATYTRVVGDTINEDFSGQVLANPLWAIYSTAGFIDGDIIYDFWDGPTDPLPTPKDKWWINRKMTANDPASMDVEWYVFDNPVLGTAGRLS